MEKPKYPKITKIEGNLITIEGNPFSEGDILQFEMPDGRRVFITEIINNTYKLNEVPPSSAKIGSEVYKMGWTSTGEISIKSPAPVNTWANTN